MCAHFRSLRSTSSRACPAPSRCGSSAARDGRRPAAATVGPARCRRRRCTGAGSREVARWRRARRRGSGTGRGRGRRRHRRTWWRTSHHRRRPPHRRARCQCRRRGSGARQDPVAPRLHIRSLVPSEGRVRSRDFGKWPIRYRIWSIPRLRRAGRERVKARMLSPTTFSAVDTSRPRRSRSSVGFCLPHPCVNHPWAGHTRPHSQKGPCPCARGSSSPPPPWRC